MKLSKKSHRQKLVQRLSILARGLVKRFPMLFQGEHIRYEEKLLAVLGDDESPIQFIDSDLRETAEQNLNRPVGVIANERRVSTAFLEYTKFNRNAFMHKVSSNPLPFQILPTSSRGSDIESGNLVWEMNVFSTYIARQMYIQGAAFDRALEYLAKRPKHRQAEKVFWSALDRIEDEIGALKKKLDELEYSWLRAKFPYQSIGARHDEARVPGYLLHIARYKALQKQFEERVAALRTINHLMFGTYPIDLMDLDSVRATVGSTLGIQTSEYGILGRNIKERVRDGCNWFLSKAGVK